MRIVFGASLPGVINFAETVEFVFPKMVLALFIILVNFVFSVVVSSVSCLGDLFSLQPKKSSTIIVQSECKVTRGFVFNFWPSFLLGNGSVHSFS